jgi:hypothetical protein
MTRVLFVGLCGVCVGVGTAPADAPPRADVSALVRQLGSEDFREREAASDQLAALPVAEAPPELLAARRSPDPEVRDRADRAVKAIRAAAALRPLARDERFAVRGRVDLYIASTAALTGKPADERIWRPAFGLVARVVAAADMKDRRPRSAPAPGETFAAYRTRQLLYFVRTDGTYRHPTDPPPGDCIVPPAAVQAARVDCEGALGGLIVSRGSAAGRVIYDSVVLANGDVTAKGVAKSVVVCDGDVTADDIANSLIIARGRIDVRRPTGCTLIAGGRITVGEFPAIMSEPINPTCDPLLVPALVRDFLVRRDREWVTLLERNSYPLGFITFFELARIGLEVRSGCAVAVSAVTAGSACEKAGLRVGDVVLDVGGTRPADAEGLRRALRDALAVGDATVRVRRGTQVIAVILALPD